MREITHEETRTVTVSDGWMSEDGRMFRTEDECMRHEREVLISRKRAECCALTAHKPMSLSYEIAESLYCSDNDTFYTFMPTEREDVERLTAYTEAAGLDVSVDNDGKGSPVPLTEYFVAESMENSCIALFSKAYVESLYERFIRQMFGGTSARGGGDVVAQITWTVADVEDAFIRKHGRDPSEEELARSVKKVDRKALESYSVEYGWDFINEVVV